jgi:tetratricopeptide (TPR) repeat protein
MDIEKHIQTLFREIEVYRSHGLFEEAKGKCEEMAEQILKSDQYNDKRELMATVSKIIRGLENDARDFEKVEASTQITTKEQDLIKELFPSSEKKGTDSEALNVAETLLVFGQFERALSKFNELIKRDTFRLIAAKNILRCHIGRGSFDYAVRQYQEWLSSGQFPSGELRKIRSFLREILRKKGVDKSLPKPKGTLGKICSFIQGIFKKREIDKSLPKQEGAIDVKEDEKLEDKLIDISSILIPLDNEHEKGTGIRLDVSSQKGNVISVIISKTNQGLIDHLKVGLRLNDVEFYSSAVTFKDSCVVSAKSRIKSGPKKGDYTLVFKIPLT